MITQLDTDCKHFSFLFNKTFQHTGLFSSVVGDFANIQVHTHIMTTAQSMFGLCQSNVE